MGDKMKEKSIFGNRRLAGELIQGAVSLTILALLMLLYFSSYNTTLWEMYQSRRFLPSLSETCFSLIKLGISNVDVV
jgi:hypothetical protein